MKVHRVSGVSSLPCISRAWYLVGSNSEEGELLLTPTRGVTHVQPTSLRTDLVNVYTEWIRRCFLYYFLRPSLHVNCEKSVFSVNRITKEFVPEPGSTLGTACTSSFSSFSARLDLVSLYITKSARGFLFISSLKLLASPLQIPHIKANKYQA